MIPPYMYGIRMFSFETFSSGAPSGLNSRTLLVLLLDLVVWGVG